MAPFSVSVCVPAFNEAGNVEALLRDCERVLGEAGVAFEIIVVDDGSRDATPAVLAALAAEVPALRVITHAANEGYGKTLRDAWAAATKDYIFYTDGDRQFDMGELAAFLPLLDGRRAVVGYRVARAEGALRRFTSWGYNAFVRLVFSLRLRDIDCSFKFLPRRAVQALDLKADKFFIDTELMLKLAAAGVPVVERGVRHLPRAYGRSTVSAGHILTTLREVAALRRELKKSRGHKGPGGMLED
jgi:glycosyltransferase involved in cell wall biosynthesis